jgi:hypothetical protein
MTHPNRVRLSKLTLGLLAALAAAPAFAQSTSAALGGTVTDETGQPVAGAEVTIVHTASGTVSRATTDASGRYNARGLRVGGPYRVTFSKAGEPTKTEDDVFLSLDSVGQVNTTLGSDVDTLDTVHVTGVATGSDVFSSEKMGAGTNIWAEQIEALPSIRRDLQDYARLDPRISQTDKERGEISAGGQNTRFNSVTIDGVTTSDTFGLESNNLPTAKQPISIDAIEAVNVNIANFDVIQRGYTGANINAVTKSGTNEFHGSATYVFRNEQALGDRYIRASDSYTDFGPFEEKTIGFTLGGPIIKDRLFFFAAYEDFTATKTLPDFGPLGSSAGTQVALSQSLIDQVRQIAQSTYGIDLGTSEIPSGFETRVKDAMVKFDWNINDNHRASLRYNKTEQNEPFLTSFGTRSLSLSSHWYDQAKEFETAVVQWFGDWSESFSTEAKLSYRSYDSQPNNNSRLPQITLGFPRRRENVPSGVLDGTINLVSGTERSRHFNVLSTDTLNAFFAANWFAGDHTVKFGADFERNDVYNAFLQDTQGQYGFNCQNSSATFTYNDPAIPNGVVNCSTSPQSVIDAAVLYNFRTGRANTYQSQQAAPGTSLNDAAAIWGLNNLGFFIQDTWAVNLNLTLNFGLRVDMPQLDEVPAYNAVASGPVGPVVNGRQTGGFGYDNRTTIDGKELWQPRFGFNYTFDSERPMQIRGGAGLFQGAAANVWLSNPFSNTGIATRIYGCGGSFAACPTNGGLFVANPDAQPTPAANQPAANVDFLAPDLEQPSVWKFNLAFEHQLPWWNTVFTAEYIQTQTETGIYYQFLNLGAPTRYGPDGRPLYYTAQGYNPACYTNTGGTSNTGACAGFRTRAGSNPNFANAILARSTNKGRGDNLTIGLSRPMINDWSWSFAYAYTELTDVNPLTSSTSNSNWNGRMIFDPNEEVASRSNYVIRDRFVGSFDWQHAFFGDYKTKVGVFYEGRKGKPYSWTYINDFNGDGIGGNDLMYIPTPGDNTVSFRDRNGNGSGDEEAAFWSIINSNPELRRHIGGVVERNEAFSPWVNQFDVRVSQELPGFMADHKTVVTLDILNIGNLINKKWGRIDEIGFPLNRSFVWNGGIDAQGRYQYIVGDAEDFVTRQERAESQWAAQITLQYRF